ncbi:MAG: hypothetical protein DRI44_10090 [Chlamydiae bacterium]|nr:MAG: hypothetical protein DRI44_10090 [Chlamydiota bacterium]
MKFELNNIYPSGFLRGLVYYEPRNIVKDRFDDEIYSYYPIASMHKYLTYDFTWLYDGTNINEKGYLDLRNLKMHVIDRKNS